MSSRSRKLSKNRVRKTKRNVRKTKRNVRKTKRNVRKSLKIQKGGWEDSELKRVVYIYLEFLKIFDITDEDIQNVIKSFKFILSKSEVKDEILKLIRDSDTDVDESGYLVINKINLMAMYIAIRLILDLPEVDINDLDLKQALPELLDAITMKRRYPRDSHDPIRNLAPPELYDAYVAAQIIIFGSAYPAFEHTIKHISTKITFVREQIAALASDERRTSQSIMAEEIGEELGEMTKKELKAEARKAGVSDDAIVDAGEGEDEKAVLIELIVASLLLSVPALSDINFFKKTHYRNLYQGYEKRLHHDKTNPTPWDDLQDKYYEKRRPPKDVTAARPTKASRRSVERGTGFECNESGLSESDLSS